MGEIKKPACGIFIHAFNLSECGKFIKSVTFIQFVPNGKSINGEARYYVESCPKMGKGDAEAIENYKVQTYANLEAFPKARLRRKMSINPIITDGIQWAITEKGKTIEDVKKSQAYNGKYSITELSIDGEEDVDLDIM